MPCSPFIKHTLHLDEDFPSFHLTPLDSFPEGEEEEAEEGAEGGGGGGGAGGGGEEKLIGLSDCLEGSSSLFHLFIHKVETCRKSSLCNTRLLFFH